MAAVLLFILCKAVRGKLRCYEESPTVQCMYSSRSYLDNYDFNVLCGPACYTMNHRLLDT